MDEISSDVRAICAARNVRTISLSGGEPLLHPQILDIVRMLKRDARSHEAETVYHAGAERCQRS